MILLFFKKRRYKKLHHHILYESKHARHMREDVADPAKIKKLEELEASFDQSWKDRNFDAMEQTGQQILEQIKGVYPCKGSPRIRENVEVIVVAVAVAMGFRTYFVQPFKIPTGSMQPTLYGITSVNEDVHSTLLDQAPFWPLKYVLTGERYRTITAKASGDIRPHSRIDGFTIYDIGGRKHKIHDSLQHHFSLGQYVKKGTVISTGVLRSGDHILVNKIAYNFRRPQRGDIFVFNTEKMANVKVDTHYIKRLVATPGDSVAINTAGYLEIDGKVADDCAAFSMPLIDKYLERPDLMRDTGGEQIIVMVPPGNGRPRIPQALPRDHGPYLVLPGQNYALSNPPYTLAKNEYLPMGDNTLSSHDGRFFGPVPEENVLGPAFGIYWPFRRFGLAK